LFEEIDLDVEKWLDDYELKLAVRDIQELEPTEIFHAWLNIDRSGKLCSWYWDEPKDD
jgi:hypothetical protein